ARSLRLIRVDVNTVIGEPGGSCAVCFGRCGKCCECRNRAGGTVSREPAPISPALGFDVHSGKVGLPVGAALRVAPNSAAWLDADTSGLSGPVLRGLQRSPPAVPS